MLPTRADLLALPGNSAQRAAFGNTCRHPADLARLDDLVFGGWDIVDTNAYAAARRAGVLDTPLIETPASELAAIRPRPGIFDAQFNR